MNPVATLKRLVIQEMRHKQPSFQLINAYLKTLQAALAREERLSVADADGLTQNDGENIGIINLAQGGVVQGIVPPRERAHDQYLTALAQVAQRSGPDPLAGLLAALPNVETLYGEGDERRAFTNRIRAAVDRRLNEAAPATPTTQENRAP